MTQGRIGDAAQRGQRPPAERAVQCTFPLRPSSVRLARHAVRRLCRTWRATPAADDAELAVSELFGNAVRAGAGKRATLRVSWTPRRLRVEVHDESALQPAVREAGPDDEGGRGLWLIRELAVRWGADTLPEGKCVWAEFALAAVA
ncbi:MAG: ATP-binding protein [Actinobacteria bacterium]|nr:ATP-binding protein [Actinomycetota bacterium]MCA1720906.1 ATP-binding protein [Actinomycetota bacterium]